MNQFSLDLSWDRCNYQKSLLNMLIYLFIVLSHSHYTHILSLPHLQPFTFAHSSPLQAIPNSIVRVGNGIVKNSRRYLSFSVCPLASHMMHQRTKQAAQIQFRIHEARPHAGVRFRTRLQRNCCFSGMKKIYCALCPLSLLLFIVLPFTVIQFLKNNSLFWFFMCRNSRTGKYWGAEEWIHGWGRPGEPMKFCPVQCTINSDTWTHEGPDKGYEKHWDREGWKQPQYSSNTAEEYKAGNTSKKDRIFRSHDTSFLPAIYPPPLLPALPPSCPFTSLSLEGSYLIAPLTPIRRARASETRICASRSGNSLQEAISCV